VEYLIYPKEVFGMLWTDYKLEIVITTLLLFLTARYAWRASHHLLHNHARWAYWQRLLVLPLVVVLIFMGGRSSFGHRAANISTAAFSGDHLTNEIGLNSTYSVAYAIYAMKNEEDSRSIYGEMDEQEMIQRVRKQMYMPEAAFSSDELPTLHHQKASTPRQRPYNLVIFLQESLGAEYVGSLGGLPLTPNLDRLGKEGIFFTNLYSTGTRTVRGIEATVAGFLPTPGRSVVKLGLAQHNFFTMADLLEQHGYATDFIYGGESHFDNMRSFFLGNGFQRVIEQQHFDEPMFLGNWGVSDEDLVHKANELFKAHGDKPFFALMLSTTNHVPFEFPEGRIELYEEPANTVNNAIKFSDYAIGELFRLAQQEEYYKNTIFLVVADHNTRVYGADLVPVHKFNIPGLIIGPGIEPQRYDKVASQVDLLPTLLDLMGLDSVHPMIGRNLLTLPDDDPGRAFMQYDRANAYRVGDQVVVQLPSKEPQQFVYQDQRLLPTALEEELVRDALAFTQLPSVLYSKQKYRLPR
jgi:phosphoglycerol transferase MdoB-like AlkP superfamily enzyme